MAFRDQLHDRFGPLPAQAINLLDSVRIKWLATSLGLEKVILKKGKLVGYFIADQQSPFYQSPAFTHILKRVQSYPKLATLREKETRTGLRLQLVIEHVKSPEQALKALQPLVIPSEAREAQG